MSDEVKTGRIAVLGDRDSIQAFQAIGAETFGANNVFEANERLKMLTAGEYAVVFVTEDIAALIPDTLAKLKTRTFPAVIPIPSSKGSSGLGLKGVKADVEKAIGADILFHSQD